MNRPLVQLALDCFDLASALGPMQQAQDYIDVVEAGTVLCYAEGMGAVKALRALYPEKILLADLRIAEAGSILAKLAFESGASMVTVVSGASLTTIEVVLKEAQKHKATVQLELIEGWTWAQAALWHDAGVEHVIAHRSRDGEAMGKLAWERSDFEQIQRLSDLGFKVSIAGGVSVEDIRLFKHIPIYLFTVGRAIRAAADPKSAAKAFQDAISEHYAC